MDLCLSSPYRTGWQSGERRVGHGGPKSKAEAIGPNRSRAYVSGRFGEEHGTLLPIGNIRHCRRHPLMNQELVKSLVPLLRRRLTAAGRLQQLSQISLRILHQHVNLPRLPRLQAVLDPLPDGRAGPDGRIAHENDDEIQQKLVGVPRPIHYPL